MEILPKIYTLQIIYWMPWWLAKVLLYMLEIDELNVIGKSYFVTWVNTNINWAVGVKLF